MKVELSIDASAGYHPLTIAAISPLLQDALED